MAETYRSQQNGMNKRGKGQLLDFDSGFVRNTKAHSLILSSLLLYRITEGDTYTRA